MYHRRTSMSENSQQNAPDTALSLICGLVTKVGCPRNSNFGRFQGNQAPDSPMPPILLTRWRADTLRGRRKSCWPACAPQWSLRCPDVLSEHLSSTAADGCYAAADGSGTLRDYRSAPSDHRICCHLQTTADPVRLTRAAKDGSWAVRAHLPSFKSIIITSKVVWPNLTRLPSWTVCGYPHQK